MIVLPLVAGAAFLGGGAYVCGKGVIVLSGSAQGIGWRVRWACWRYIAEVNIAGNWVQAGTFPLGENGKAAAVGMALSSAAAASALPATGQEPMVRIVRATRA